MKSVDLVSFTHFNCFLSKRMCLFTYKSYLFYSVNYNGELHLVTKIQNFNRLFSCLEKLCPFMNIDEGRVHVRGKSGDCSFLLFLKMFFLNVLHTCIYMYINYEDFVPSQIFVYDSLKVAVVIT